MTNRVSPARFVVFFSLLVSEITGATVESASAKPNILFILTDDRVDKRSAATAVPKLPRRISTGWHAGQIAVPNTPEFVNPNETVIVQLADGRVMLNVRNESTKERRLVVTSPDGATDWSKPKFDDALLEPICMGAIARVSDASTGDKNRIVFANPSTLANADSKVDLTKRRNLSVKLSYDEGATWPVNKTLEAGASGYSDLAVLPDGTILCLYGRGNDPTKTMYKSVTLTLARFNLEWLTDDRDSFTLPKK